MSDYKAHLHQSLGNGVLHPRRMQCGRHILRNERGTFSLKTSAFKKLAVSEPEAVCKKCLQWLIDTGKVTI